MLNRQLLNLTLSLPAPVLMTRSMMIMVLHRAPSVDLMTTQAPNVLNIPQINVANMAVPLAPSVVPLMNILRCLASVLAMIMVQAPSMITRRPLPASVKITNARWRYAICQFHQVVLALVALVVLTFTRATRAAVPAHMCTRTTLVMLPHPMVTRTTQVVGLAVVAVGTMMPIVAIHLITDVAALTTWHSE